MAAQSNKSAKRVTYRITAMRTQFVQFDVVAMSSEGACKRLQERLKRDGSADVPSDAHVVLSTWSDPNCSGEQWFIEGGECLQDPTTGRLHVWNGKAITRASLPRELKLYLASMEHVEDPAPAN